MLILLFIPFTFAHLILNEPFIWGINDGGSLEQPLEMTTDNWICAGKNPEENGIVTLEAGKTYKYSTTCGEKDLNADGCLGGDWHLNENFDDYAGCVLGVSYSDYTNMNDWKYISYQKDCAKRSALNSFTIADNVESIEKGVCSWAWIPSIDHSTPQSYMNCFYCKIIGNGDKNTMKQMEFANVPGAQHTEKVYNDLNIDIYDIQLPNESSKLNPTKTNKPKRTNKKGKKTRTRKRKNKQIKTSCL